MQENQYLSVIMLGENNTEYLREVSHLIAQHECQTLNCHTQLHGELFSISFLISAPWSVIAKIETKFKTLAQKFSYEIFLKRVHLIPQEKPQFSYFLYLSSLENNHAFYQVMRFLHQHHVEIVELFIDSYKTRTHQTAMMSFTIKILLPGDTAISDWRDRFMLFCDDLNIDGAMEPEKG